MTQEMNETKQAIWSVIDKFTQAWNVHDAKNFALLFMEDADFTNVFGQKAHGRPMIEKIHGAIFATMFRESQLVATEISVRLIGNDLAAVDVFWHMTGATDIQGKPWPNRKGLMNLTMQNNGELWLILVMHNMDLPAVALN